MKKFRSYFIVISLFFLQQNAFCQFNSYPQRISDIPFPPYQTSKVEVFFPNENKYPSKPFIKMLNLYVEAYTNAAVLTSMMMGQAQRMGMDALIELKDSIVEREVMIDGFYQWVKYRTLKGVAIKYTENITYLHLIPRKQTVYKYDEDQRESLLGELHFSPFKESIEVRGVDEKAKERLENEVKRYSLEHLIYEQGNWRYTGNIKKPTKRRLYRLNDWVLRECIFRYDANTNRLIRIILDNSNNTIKELIKIIYNSQGFISEKVITTFTNKKLKEVFKYDESGKLIEILYYVVRTNEGKRYKNPKLTKRAVLEYFTKEDFSQSLSEQTVNLK